MAIQPTGKIVTVFDVVKYRINEAHVRRYNADGTRDISFAEASFINAAARYVSNFLLTLQNNGDIVFAFSSVQICQTCDHFSVVRFADNGSYSGFSFGGEIPPNTEPQPRWPCKTTEKFWLLQRGQT